ncbi:MAG: heavy-metal-associated domain-containing protein [Candidatus Paceibacteria bacterium]
MILVYLLLERDFGFSLISKFKNFINKRIQGENKKSTLIGFGVAYAAGGLSCFLPVFLPSRSQVVKTKDLKKLTLKIEGMYCVGCERSIEGSVGSLQGVKKVDADLQSNSGIVVYNSQKIDKKKIVNNSIFDVYPAKIRKVQKYKK